MASLTPAEEQFALALTMGSTQADAYRLAFPHSQDWQPQSVYPKACELAGEDKIKIRIGALRAKVAKKSEYTLQTAMEEALEAFKDSKEWKQGGAMVAAAMMRAKLQGLVTEKKEISVTQFPTLGAQSKAEILQAALAEVEKRKRIPAPSDVTDVEPKL